MRNFIGKVKRGVKKVMSKINDVVNQNVDNQLKKVDKVVEILKDKELVSNVMIVIGSMCLVGGIIYKNL